MKKYYTLKQINGNSTTECLVANIRIEGLAVYATKVGELKLGKTNFSSHKVVFDHVKPHKIISVGNTILEEVEDPFDEEDCEESTSE